MIYNLIIIVCLLSSLILFHELGHFVFAKIFGIKVLKFAIGFGPKLFSKKFSETEYIVSLVPLGGYIQMLGESKDENCSKEDLNYSFYNQKGWKKILIIVGGPLFNFILTIVLLTIVNLIGLQLISNTIGNVETKSIAAKIDLRKGDRIIAINNKQVFSWPEIFSSIKDSKNQKCNIKIERNSNSILIKELPYLTKIKTNNDLGIQPCEKKIFLKSENLINAIKVSFIKTFIYFKIILFNLFLLFKGNFSISTFNGPLMIGQMAMIELQKGFLYFLLFLAILSLNLGIINLLPIPVLDGGHLILNLFEIIIGKNITNKWRMILHQIGFIFLLIITCIVFYNDIVSLFIKG